MTDIQVKYWANQENARHNLVTEEETGRANRAGEGLRSAELTETVTSHRNTEGLKSQELGETKRKNLEDASIRWSELGEKKRANLENEGINRMMASASTVQAAASMKNAESNQRNAATNERNATTNEAKQGSYAQMVDSQTAALDASTAYQQMANSVKSFGLESEKVTQNMVNNLKPISEATSAIGNLMGGVYGKSGTTDSVFGKPLSQLFQKAQEAPEEPQVTFRNYSMNQLK